jgi:nucleoside-diphosphate-sugar epimerase
VNVFILGGRGFVGSAFVRTCAQRRLDYAVIDRQNYAEFVGQRCDLFVNANGNSRKPLATESPVLEFEA